MPDEDLRQAIIESLELWTQGNQQGAVDRLRPLADERVAPALALICWYLHQLGEPGWRQGLEYAKAAVEKGMPWVTGYFVGNILGDASLRQEAPALFRQALDAGWQLDPVAHAVGPFQQGDRAVAVELVLLASGPWPYPLGWSEFLSGARSDVAELHAAAGVVSERRDSALQAIESDVGRVAENADALETRKQQLFTLIDELTNAEAQTFFDAEAERNEEEGTKLWRWGVQVLGAAALFAVLPILIYYVGKIFGENPFAGENLVAAHFAPALALGAVAGVLLARARNRDRARQRARDLSVALGTMFVYSGQIAQEEERQRFLHDMGRTVIEAFLRHDSPAGDQESASLLSALVQRR